MANLLRHSPCGCPIRPPQPELEFSANDKAKIDLLGRHKAAVEKYEDFVRQNEELRRNDFSKYWELLKPYKISVENLDRQVKTYCTEHEMQRLERSLAKREKKIRRYEEALKQYEREMAEYIAANPNAKPAEIKHRNGRKLSTMVHCPFSIDYDVKMLHYTNKDGKTFVRQINADIAKIMLKKRKYTMTNRMKKEDVIIYENELIALVNYMTRTTQQYNPPEEDKQSVIRWIGKIPEYKLKL